MVDYVLLTCFALSFIVTYLLTPYWIKAAKIVGLTGKDLNKYGKPDVAEMGGLPVNAGFITGVFTYIALRSFYLREDAKLIPLLAVSSTLLIIVIVGMIDDILGWKIGLRKWQKPVLTSIAAMPMMAINAGESSMLLPLLGNVDLGLIYPLVIIPIGITGATNGFNMLAGFNGLEAGMGIIILSSLGYIAWESGNSWITMLSLSMVFALLAFLKYNWDPAKIFPGDTLTYSMGALVASVAILGNMERPALILFSLYFLELLLKARTKFKGESYGVPNEGGTIVAPKRLESLTHIALKLGLRKESHVTIGLLSIQFVLAAIVIFI